MHTPLPSTALESSTSNIIQSQIEVSDEYIPSMVFFTHKLDKPDHNSQKTEISYL